VHDQFSDDELLIEDEIAYRRPRFVDLLLAADAVAMEKRDMRSEHPSLRAKNGFAEAPEVALRIFDDQEEARVGRQPSCGPRDPQPERGHRGSDRDEPLEVSRLIDHRYVRLDRRGRLRIPTMTKLVDARPEIAGELRYRDAPGGRGFDQVGVCASVSAR
jgi:hypothetical protein